MIRPSRLTPRRLLILALPLLTLGGCSSSNPLDLIPAGLRSTFGAEDRAAQPNRPVSVEDLLAKARGEAPPRAQDRPTARPEPMPPGMVAALASLPPAASPPVKAAPAPTSRLVFRFAGDSHKLSSEDALRLQLATARASRQGGEIAIRVGPAGQDRLTALPTALRRGEAIRSLLPDNLARAADIAFSPGIEAETAVIEFLPDRS